ncbi:class D sortase [Pseudoflavonifractor sp. 60]|uniref:class D sortase n=1 Tax=Pseudoflavonifractor sp. 60 TaxID=2304576 RepID=UPI00136E2C9B|nr:class D sortase [Pseudoflavonifractor sp. 60]NBI65966.1 class D sortase [Pseudoflavonifractor sp. 60]
MKRMNVFLSALCLTAALVIPASAAAPMEYSFSGTGDPEYGRATSIEVVHTPDGGAMKNEDVSKNAALAPPAFGSLSADTLNTGTPLTPNLAPGYQAAFGASVNGSSAAIQPPSMTGAAIADNSSGVVYVPGASTLTVTTSPISTGYTEVTNDLYYSGGHLGTLKIPAISVNVKVYEGTDTKALAKGAGHFTETSIWDGNVALAGHNRGAHGIFDDIHTLNLGDKITLTTRLGTRTYAVTSVSKVSETDRSALAASTQNMLTIYTCVRDQSAYRWCVRAVEVV